MSAFWPTDDGWPYPDSGREEEDPSPGADDDLLSLQASRGHLMDGLDDAERTVVTGRFGLDGRPPRTMKELGRELGVPRSELRGVLGSGLSKVRHNLDD